MNQKWIRAALGAALTVGAVWKLAELIPLQQARAAHAARAWWL
jgi:hypothetical protein